MLSRTYFVAAVVAVMLATTPVVAHHSFSAEFDITKTIKLSGKVSSVRWSNPHAWIYIDVTGTDGKVVNWAFEMNAANSLYRRGWRREDVPAGLEVTIEGWLARNGTPTANTNTIILPDGRRLFAGSGPGEGAAPR